MIVRRHHGSDVRKRVSLRLARSGPKHGTWEIGAVRWRTSLSPSIQGRNECRRMSVRKSILPAILKLEGECRIASNPEDRKTKLIRTMRTTNSTGQELHVAFCWSNLVENLWLKVD